MATALRELGHRIFEVHWCSMRNPRSSGGTLWLMSVRRKSTRAVQTGKVRRILRPTQLLRGVFFTKYGNFISNRRNGLSRLQLLRGFSELPASISILPFWSFRGFQSSAEVLRQKFQGPERLCVIGPKVRQKRGSYDSHACI